MQATLRKVLIDSHVAAIAIAFMLFECIQEASLALWGPACGLYSFLAAFVAIRIHVISYIPLTPDSLTQQMFKTSANDLVLVLVNLTGAWFLSLLVYGAGPLRSLGSYKAKLSRKPYA